jgi:pilus assembly protein Flp/PilA
MLARIKGTAVRLWKDERGASLLEYSILIGLITAGVVTTVITVGTWVGTQWSDLRDNLGITTGGTGGTGG